MCCFGRYSPALAANGQAGGGALAGGATAKRCTRDSSRYCARQDCGRTATCRVTRRISGGRCADVGVCGQKMVTCCRGEIGDASAAGGQVALYL